MKSFTVVILMCISMNVFAQEHLNSFDKILNAFKEGKDVKVVIYYGNCEMFSDGVKQEKSPNAIGGMELNTYEYFDSSVFRAKLPSFISTSQTVLIHHRKYGYVYNYVKLRINSNGSIDISARYLKPRKLSSKFKVVMDETFKTKISELKKDAGIVFYAL